MAKILLVEDDKALREIYGTRLLAEGYDIVSAGDGEEALPVAIKEQPDLIISDVMMPKISGFEMLDLLKSNDATKNIKVIMMTALSSEQQRERGEELGAERYLVKSQVGIEDVVRTVHEVLGDQNQQAAPATPAPNQSPINPPAATNPAAVLGQNISLAAAPDSPTSTPNPTEIPPGQNSNQVPAGSTSLTSPVSAGQTPTAPSLNSSGQTAPNSAPAAPDSTVQTFSNQSSAQPTSAPRPDMTSNALLPDQPDDKSATHNDSVNLTSSGSSFGGRVIQPTGETLSPKVDIGALLAKEEAKEMGVDPDNLKATSDQPAPSQISAAPPLNLPGINISENGILSGNSASPSPTEPALISPQPADDSAAPTLTPQLQPAADDSTPAATITPGADGSNPQPVPDVASDNSNEAASGDSNNAVPTLATEILGSNPAPAADDQFNIPPELLNQISSAAQPAPSASSANNNPATPNPNEPVSTQTTTAPAVMNLSNSDFSQPNQQAPASDQPGAPAESAPTPPLPPVAPPNA
ncbi:MAG: response regulator [Candidatus Nomurabacteria bacterium]|jgi:CheY-like chemotaxis protein|nr:response regulator [Candidatus Nomurabacteria bacterium]